LASLLIGNGGNDYLDGYRGSDTLEGGAGQDVFILSDKLSIDTITDFSVADDTIRFDSGVFNKLVALDGLNINQFKIGTGAADADDYIIYNSSTGALSYDEDGSGATAAVQIALLGKNLALTHADFYVY
jgi:Ca2+-binding RTX toxin-like protein